MSGVATGSVGPEAAMLLLCARARLSAAERQAMQSLCDAGLRWPQLLAMSNRHGMHPFLYRHLADVCPEQLSREAHAELWSRHERLLRRNQAQAEELQRLLRALQEAGIDAIPYKGPVLAMQLHGDLSLREFGDLDILLPRERVLAAKQSLLALGYEAAYPIGEAAERYMLDAPSHYHFVLSRGDSAYVVELHWRTDPDFPAEESELPGWWQQRPREQLINITHPTFHRRELFLLLCLHGSKHHWSSLRWLADAAELALSLDEDDWRWTLARSRRLRATRRYTLGLLLLRRMFGRALPPFVETELSTAAAMSAEADRLQAELLSENSVSPGAFALLQRDFRLLDTPAQRFRFVLRTLLGPSMAELTRWRLPRPLYFLYAPLRLARLLTKRLPAFYSSEDRP